MIGAEGLTVIAYKSDSGYWEPYMLYPSGPYPGNSLSKGWEFFAVVNGKWYAFSEGRGKFSNWQEIR